MPIIARSVTLPAPVGGLNTKDPIDLMPATDAYVLKNIFPSTADVRLRKGYVVHQEGLGGAVETLAEYSAAANRKLLAGAAGNIWDVTTFGGAPSSLKSGITENKWQTRNFNDYMIFVNGTDQPLKFDGTVITDAVYTGITDDADLITVDVYKSRLYFVEKDSGSIWYGGVNAVQGALTEFDVQSILRYGGQLEFVGSFTRDTGVGIQDLLVIISNMGEVLLYEGDNPSDASWNLVGRVYLSKPLGRRAFTNYGADIFIITDSGVVSLNQVIQTGQVVEEGKLSNKISQVYLDAAIANGAAWGWQGQVYPRGNFYLVNFPKRVGFYNQFVMSLQTGAWTVFDGLNAYSWSLLNEKLYFGDGSGNIFLADTGFSDNGDQIEWELRSAFNYMEDRATSKRFNMARPITAVSGETVIKIFITVDFDEDILDIPYQDDSDIEGAEWNTAVWDVDYWSYPLTIKNISWQSIIGIGRSMSYVMRGRFSRITFSLTAVNANFETGGYI